MKNQAYKFRVTRYPALHNYWQNLYADNVQYNPRELPIEWLHQAFAYTPQYVDQSYLQKLFKHFKFTPSK